VDASYDQGDAFLAVSYSNNRSDLQFGDGIGGMGMPSRLPDSFMSLTAGLRMFDRKLTLGWRMNDVSNSTPIVGGSSLDTTAYRTHDLFANYQPSDRLSLFANVTNLQDIQYIPAMSQDQGPGRRIFGGATLKLGDGPMFEGVGPSPAFPLIGSLLGSDSDADLNVDWSGIRVGVAGGYSWSSVSTDTYLIPNLWYPQNGFHVPFQDQRSYSAHVQGGYDHQFSNGVVLGIEGAAAFGDFQRFRDTIVLGGALAANGRDTRNFVDIDSEVEWSASVKGRLGYAFGRYLPFIAAGVSMADYSHSFVFWDGPNAIDPARPEHPNYDYRGQHYIGWTVGGGIEYALTEKLSLKTEYSFSDFGAKKFGWKQQNDNRGRSPYNIDSQYRISLMQHDFNVGIAYRF